jgi:hypothetical protein
VELVHIREQNRDKNVTTIMLDKQKYQLNIIMLQDLGYFIMATK